MPVRLYLVLFKDHKRGIFIGTKTFGKGGLSRVVNASWNGESPKV